MATERTLAHPRERVRADSLARLAGLPLLAAGALLLAVVARVVIAGNIPTPWIMVDEIIYSELAKSFAAGEGLEIRDRASEIPSVLYPIAISPAWLADEIPTAYGIAKAINVVLMTLVVVPTYLWSRRLVSPVWALVPAALVLLMPSFHYTGVLMSENAFFPVFVAAGWSFALALERPTLGRQALALALVGIAVGVRLQGVVLLAVLPAAIVLKALLDARVPGPEPAGRRLLATARAFTPTWAVLAGGAVAFLALQWIRGSSPSSALGSYDVVATADYRLGEVGHWIVLHFAELGFSVGIVPACAFLLLAGLAVLRPRTLSAAERSFVAVTAAAVFLVVLQVAVFASRFSLRIEERYMFPLAPLLFLALVLWLSRGLERPPLVAAAAALVPVLLLVPVRLDELLGVQILSDTFGLIPVWRAAQLLDGGTDTAQTLFWAGGAAAAAAFLFVPRRAGLLLPIAVAGFLALSSYPVYGAVRDFARSLEAYAGGGELDWIDDTIGTGADAPYLFDAARVPGYDDMVLWQTEFWNRSLGTSVRLGPPVRDSLEEQVGSVDPVTGRIDAPAVGSPEYAVAASGLALAGEGLASRSLLTLFRLDRPLRLASAVDGVYADGWMGATAAYSYYADAPGRRVNVALSREAWGGEDVPGTVTIQVGRPVASGSGAVIGTVTARQSIVLHRLERRVVTLAAPKPPFRVEITISPTFSPSQFGQADTRQLGAVVTFSAS